MSLKMQTLDGKYSFAIFDRLVCWEQYNYDVYIPRVTKLTA